MSTTLHSRGARAARPLIALAALGLFLLPNLSCTRQPRYSDESFYEDVAWGVMTGLSDIFNQNLAGTPTGTVDITAPGPFGGTVHITGTTSFDSGHGIETVHLAYDMVACQVSSTSSASDLNVNLTLTGAITEDGSWSSAGTSLSYNCPTLSMNGTSKRGDKSRDVSGSTSFKANQTSSGTSAELFGFDVSW